MTAPTSQPDSETTRLTRWRLILGAPSQDCLPDVCLSGVDKARDHTLSTVYGVSGSSDLTKKRTSVAQWLGDVRSYFPKTVADVMQQDGIEQVGLMKMLAEPETAQSMTYGVDTVAQIVQSQEVIPEDSRNTAREVVRQVTHDLMDKLRTTTTSSLTGALNRAARRQRPRMADVNWNKTLLANLKNYQPEYGTVIPEKLVGFGRQRTSFDRHIILLIDQSGSMASSIVYSSIFGAVMASIPALSVSLVAFDDAVVDLTDELGDPVDVLFGIQLGGGTNITNALEYVRGRITCPENTTVVMITDLYHNGPAASVVASANTLVSTGADLICLLALDDSGSPGYCPDIASELAALSVPAFACTPNIFPDMMAHVLDDRCITAWAEANNVRLMSPIP